MGLKLDELKVRSLMLENGIKTQVELAQRAGVSQNTLVTALRGTRVIDLTTLDKLARALGTHPFSILIAEGYSVIAPHLAAPAAQASAIAA